jgi:hypothetical protein
MRILSNIRGNSKEAKGVIYSKDLIQKNNKNFIDNNFYLDFDLVMQQMEAGSIKDMINQFT